MPNDWEFLQATPAERAAFCDLAAVLALPWTSAAEPNRNRSVRRVTDSGANYFVKQFGPTQWNNRLRFQATAPRAHDDAAREAAMTLALQAAGIAAPRPILRAAHRAGSIYICAQIAGEPLSDLLLLGKANPALLRAAATFCGDLLRRGFWLPDLSAEHLFAQPNQDSVLFGVIDLHNGRIAAPGAPPRWLLRRVLRHCARSVERLPVTRGMALRFATRLVRAAGRPTWIRALLKGLPPFDTAARYEASGKSTRYAERNPERTARELQLLNAVWPGRAGESVLDVPCGAGRLLPFLRARNHDVIWADGAFAMLREARARSSGAIPAVLQTDAVRLALGDRCVDGVVQFRFLHHLPPSKAKVAVAECCRVARRFVVVSFFHPCSIHHLQRRLRDTIRGAAARRHAVTLARMQRWFAAHGYQMTAHRAEMPFAKDLWVAAFVRSDVR